MQKGNRVSTTLHSFPVGMRAPPIFYWEAEKKEVGHILTSRGARDRFHGVHFQQLSLPSICFSEICKTEP